MDRNGYNPSIVGTGDECFLCLKGGELVRHEIFHGPYREKSKEYGLWCTLCPKCHWKLHNGNGKDDRFLKHVGYTNAMSRYGWTNDEFRQLFGKIYITEDKEK